MNKEDQNIEYKQSWHDEYLKWICGFANAQGGKLIIGVDDDGNAVGVANAPKLMEDIPNKIVSLLGIVADVNLVRRGNADTVEVVVAPSPVPVLYHGVCHYRSGSTKQELTGIALQQFILKKMGRSWDDVGNERATVDDIDRAAIDYFLRKATDARRIAPTSPNANTMQILQSLGLIDDDGHLKNAALLLFGKQPLRFFPCVEFRIGRFGLDETDLMFQDSIDGNIIQMTDRVVEVLKSKYLISPIHYEGLQRIEPLEVPEDALREMIFNSIIHKDYTGVHIQLKVYNDRLVLWNDGALPDGYTIDTLLGDHASKPRNKNIAAVFYRAGFIESWGRGIRKICDGFSSANLPKPVFESHCGGVRVTVMRPDAARGGKRDKEGAGLKTGLKTGLKGSGSAPQTMEMLIAEDPTITIPMLATATGLSRNGVLYHLKTLKDKRGLVRIGGRKSGHWEFRPD